MGKQAAFTLSGNIITENKTGYELRVLNPGPKYRLEYALGKKPDNKKGADALKKRVADWYYFTTVSPKESVEDVARKVFEKINDLAYDAIIKSRMLRKE